MKIAICEDDIYMAETLKSYLKDFLESKEMLFTIELFDTAAKFYASTENFDLLFLDYELPDSNGMNIAKDLRKTNNKTTIIFTTSFSEYVFESFEVNTFRYIVKPVTREELEKTMTAFINNFEQYAKIDIPTDGGEVVFASLPEIMYIESNGRYTTVRLNSTSYVSSKALTTFQAEINSFKFYRTHRTFLVNMKYIAEINGNVITLTNGEKVSISRRNLSTFNNAYFNFLKYSDL